MGGGASQGKSETEIKTAAKTISNLANPKDVFTVYHEIFRNKILCNEITEDLLKSEDIKSATIDRLTVLAKKWEAKAKKEGITLEDFQNLLCQLLGENLVKKYLEVPLYDIFKVMNQIYSTLSMPEDKAKDWKKVNEIFQKEFELNMKTIVYNVDKELKDLNKIQILGMNANLKYHLDFQTRVITVIITQKFLENKEVATDLADVIEKSAKLQIVIFILYPTDSNDNVLDTFGFDASDYKIIYKLFNAVTRNRGIKALFFHSIRDYKIIIAPEISNLIINKLQSETLVAFHLGNFSISKDFFKKLFFQIISTRSMLFLSLHINQDLGNLVSFSSVLEKNNSLIAFALGGTAPKTKEQIDKLKEKLALKPKPIDLVYIGEKSFIFYPFVIQK